MIFNIFFLSFLNYYYCKLFEVFLYLPPNDFSIIIIYCMLIFFQNVFNLYFRWYSHTFLSRSSDKPLPLVTCKVPYFILQSNFLSFTGILWEGGGVHLSQSTDFYLSFFIKIMPTSMREGYID